MKHILIYYCILHFRKTNFFSEHQAGYDAFCESVIKQRLEVNYEILRMTKLQQLLIRHIQLEEGVLLENIRYVSMYCYYMLGYIH